MGVGGRHTHSYLHPPASPWSIQPRHRVAKANQNPLPFNPRLVLGVIMGALPGLRAVPGPGGAGLANGHQRPLVQNPLVHVPFQGTDTSLSLRFLICKISGAGQAWIQVCSLWPIVVQEYWLSPCLAEAVQLC